MDRRKFLASSAAVVAAARNISAAGPIPKRPYRGGIELSVIGFGGIVVVGMQQQQANNIVAEAFDRGINYYDVAPSYGKGEAEEKLGPALRAYRDRVFLACKTQQRDALAAQKELEQSLKRLHTDHLDLYQLHAVSTMKDVEQILAPGGAAEMFLKARKQGKVRFLGFSAHSAQAALALMDRFQFDSVLFPVNYVCHAEGNFGPQILAKAKAKGVSRLALKALALTRWPEGLERSRRSHPKCWYQPIDDPELARKALSYTLAQEITAAIPPGDERLFRMAMDVAPGVTPMSAADQTKLLDSAKGITPIFTA